MSTPHVVCSTPPIYGTPFIADVTALLLYAPSLRCVLRQYMSASTHTMQCDAPKPIPKQTSQHVARERQTNVAPTLRWWTWKQGGPKLLPVRTNRCTRRDKHACYQTHSSFPRVSMIPSETRTFPHTFVHTPLHRCTCTHPPFVFFSSSTKVFVGPCCFVRSHDVGRARAAQASQVSSTPWPRVRLAAGMAGRT